MLAMGRSGTMWLAEAITAASTVDAHHESIQPDGELGNIGPGVEVSSLLRHRINEIKATYNVPIVHLVRDGRMVVRSALNRNPHMSFVEACHGWNGAVWRLSFHPHYRLEDLTTKVEIFCEFCARFGVDCSEDAWDLIRGDKMNATESFGVDHHTRWPLAWQDAFWSICGPMMRHYGYA